MENKIANVKFTELNMEIITTLFYLIISNKELKAKFVFDVNDLIKHSKLSDNKILKQKVKEIKKEIKKEFNTNYFTITQE